MSQIASDSLEARPKQRSKIYLDALSTALHITDEADIPELKGTKKRKGKKIDDPDFVSSLKPIMGRGVPKVVQAMHNTQDAKPEGLVEIIDSQKVLLEEQID